MTFIDNLTITLLNNLPLNMWRKPGNATVDHVRSHTSYSLIDSKNLTEHICYRKIEEELKNETS